MIHTYTDHLLIGLTDFFDWAKWLFLLAIVLTIGDLKFGIEAARQRKEEIKKSRATRRTINKIGGYFLWVVMAYCFGEAFSKPFGIDILPLLILVIIYGVELESIFTNYFQARGRKINVKLNFFRKSDILKIEEDDKNKQEF